MKAYVIVFRSDDEDGTAVVIAPDRAAAIATFEGHYGPRYTYPDVDEYPVDGPRILAATWTCGG